MHVNYKNRKDLESICVHDSVFYGFEYLYSQKQIKFGCNFSFNHTNISFVFNNVVFFNVQTCFLWGSGPHIMWLSLEDESPYMNELNKLKTENRLTSDSILGRNISFIQISFQLNSGDTIFIICESVDVEESSI